MQVVRLRLSNLPFLNEKTLMKGLEKSLRKYGDILDVGILLEPTTGTYMCTGYAVLNVASKTETFEPLTHLIPWDEQRECGFYAVWNQVPVYCCYCHEKGHVVANCSKRKIRHICWNCGVVGHIAAKCSWDKPPKKARKQPEPPNKLFDTVKPHNALPKVVPNDVCAPDEVSEELMEDLYSVKRPKKDRRPTPYVLPATRSKSTLLKAQLPKPEQGEFVDMKSNNTNKQSKFIKHLCSLWSRHCGIISFSPSFVFSTDLTPENDRAILTKITHPHNAFAPFYVLVIYAPATSDQHRSQFFDQLFDPLHSLTLDINLNLSIGAPRSQKATYTNWILPGQITHFCRLLAALVPPLLDLIFGSAVKSWDNIKRQVKKTTRTFAVDYTNWHTKAIRNRHKFLRSKPPLAIRLHQLPILDQQIASLQELTDILVLKANVRWQEAGEASIKYLKSMYRKRTVEQHITTLRFDDNEDPVEGIDQLLPITQQFYQPLYDADPVDNLQLDSYLQENHKVSSKA
ncbi:hypothetical protein G6F43_009480 [Rhizopus delemar]|nr:hypothetical protein G6F43_009480 [Rhizopus delemar]